MSGFTQGSEAINNHHLQYLVYRINQDMPPSASLLHNEPRLRAVRAVLPEKVADDPEFDRIARLAAKALGAPTSFVTLIDSTKQTFIGVSGPPAAMGNDREGPHENSLCKHTALSGGVVSITDAANDPLFCNNPIVHGLGIGSYLGIPLVTAEGHTVGSICVIDYQARVWTLEEIDLLRDYAAVAAGQLDAVASHAKIRMAFDVALHDLKTPLSGLSMASGLMSERMESLPTYLKPLVQVVESTTAAAIQLVQTLSGQNRKEPSQDCSDPVAVIRQIVSKLKDPANAKKITVTIDAGEAQSVRAPQWVLEQIIENLTGNSIKFSPAGSTVTISFSTDGNSAYIHVRDQGPGFSDHDRAKMYSRYARLSALPDGTGSSSGLGLSIVKKLADDHGGFIALISNSDESAEFQISFPLAV
jgi:signal transduction histidine kinase